MADDKITILKNLLEDIDGMLGVIELTSGKGCFYRKIRKNLVKRIIGLRKELDEYLDEQ